MGAFGDPRLGDCESSASLGITTYHSEGEAFTGLCGASAYGYILVYAAYFIVLEWLVGGTVGKMVLRLRVQKADNTKLNFVSALVRNLLRVIDFLPFAYLLGAILIWTSPHRQRLGDRLAKTVVVRH